MARAKDSDAFAATQSSADTPAAVAANPGTLPSAAAAPMTPAAPPPAAEPQSGTVTLQRPATSGHVWLDGQKLNAASAAVPCGKHQVKVGSHGKIHSIDVPCGGDVHVSR